MIVLVLSMHAADTYSPFGNWYYKEAHPVGFGAALVFATYQSLLQAFFMALLFFLAGYFAAGSYDRKGFALFLRDRIVRLGIPTLLYMLVLGPLTQYFLSRTWGSGGFGYQWLTHLHDGEWQSETGPMWFCAALLVFSAIYASFRVLRPNRPPLERPNHHPGNSDVLAFLAVLAATTFLLRIVLPEDRSVLNMHFGDFPQYLLMFAAGVAAFRGRWLTTLSERFCLRWAALTLIPAVPLFAQLILRGGALQDDLSRYAGGFNLVSAGKCLWEALICTGVSLLLLAIYRRWFDRQGPLARRLSDCAFGVYCIHLPLLISAALLLRELAAPGIIKAALLTFLAAALSYGVVMLVLRRTPLLRAIL
jgi:hypothetical protein